jgi:8-oxo-dGTP diphosphatase
MVHHDTTRFSDNVTAVLSQSIMTTSRLPRIGVGVIVQRGDRVLLGKRRSASHGDGVWQFPGGHLEWGESVLACAQREVLEETGLAVRIIGQGPYTNDVFTAAEPEAEKHYVTLFVLAESEAGEPQRLEPDKCDAWAWFAWDALPSPLFLPIVHLLEGGWTPPPPSMQSSGAT